MRLLSIVAFFPRACTHVKVFYPFDVEQKNIIQLYECFNMRMRYCVRRRRTLPSRDDADVTAGCCGLLRFLHVAFLAFSKTNRACDDSTAKEVMLSAIKCPNYYIACFNFWSCSLHKLYRIFQLYMSSPAISPADRGRYT